MENYNTYQLSWKDNISFTMQGFIVVIILGILFYRSIIGIIIISPIVYLYRRKKISRLLRERKWKLNLEFKEGILSLAAALEAGYSAENAFEEACLDLRRIYSDNAIIIKEFSYILNQIHMNISVEKALNDFSERTGVDDILSFSEVFHTAKRTGGDLINVIKITANTISDKIEIKRQIITLITAKRLEANIMKIIPLIILIYLSVSSPEFLNPLYHNLVGIIIMSLFLLFYLGAYLMIDWIIQIEV